MGYYIGTNPAEIFRGIDKAAPSEYSTKPKTTPLADSAFAKAENKTDKSGITVALEDFTKLTNSFNESGRSQVRAKDAKSGFFESIGNFFGKKSDNVFKTDEMKEALKNGSYTQNDIYAEDVAKNGGLLYAKDGDDIHKSALNFAKADIQAVEKSFSNAHVEDGFSGKKNTLDTGEISSYISDNTFLSDNLKDLDLDGKAKTISAEEYASYVVLADSLGTKDGKITADESKKFQEMDAADIQKQAKSIFDNNYKK